MAQNVKKDSTDEMAKLIAENELLKAQNKEKDEALAQTAKIIESNPSGNPDSLSEQLIAQNKELKEQLAKATAEAKSFETVKKDAPKTEAEPKTYKVYLEPGVNKLPYKGSINGVPFVVPRGEETFLTQDQYDVFMNTMSQDKKVEEAVMAARKESFGSWLGDGITR